mgnify:CR=1 FL=1|tara:strand:+ start:523 stop:723 length:201 start_codon:yes stop_codon:yes gene_type:complete
MHDDHDASIIVGMTVARIDREVADLVGRVRDAASRPALLEDAAQIAELGTMLVNLAAEIVRPKEAP